MIKAVIFDLDGTILDNEGVYNEVFRKILQNYGVGIHNHKLAQTSGIGVKENWMILKERHDIPATPKELTERTEKLYLSLLDEVKIRPGFFPLLKFLKEKGIRILLATSASKDTLGGVFSHLPEMKMGKIFDWIVTGDGVRAKKPEPDLFLKASQDAGVRPKDCLVLEDSPSGAESSRRAGMPVIILSSPWLEEKDFGKVLRFAQDFRQVKSLLANLT